MSLAVGWDLPFGVILRTVPAGSLLRIVGRFPADPTEQDIGRVHAHVKIWVAGAMYGMAGSPTVSPKMHSGPLDVGALLKVTKLPAPETISFEADGLVIEPTYAAVLIHKLYCLTYYGNPLISVEIDVPTPNALAGSVPIVRGEVSQFPPLAQPLPFKCGLNLDTGCDSIAVTSWFTDSLSADQLGILQNACFTWSAQVLQGGYTSPPFTPEDFFIQPADDLDVVDEEVVWNLDKVYINLEAFHALVSLFAAFSQRFTRVEELSIG
jgi:hypothetical protein